MTTTTTVDMETMLLQGASFALVLRMAAGVDLESMCDAPRASAPVDAATVRPGR